MKATKKIAHTNTRLVGTFRVGPAQYHVDIPKGTRCKRIDVGAGPNSDKNKFWVDDLSWISPEDHMLKHDAYFYGIVLNSDVVA